MRAKKLLAAIILLALLFRLPSIGANFSGDEVDIAGPARSYSIAGDLRQFDECTGPHFNYSHPIVRLFIYSSWSAVFGFSNIALRMLAVILGLASIVVIYFIGKEMHSEKIGLIAALLAAVSRYHVYTSTSLGTDSIHFVLTTSAAFLFFLIYLKKDSQKHLIASALLMTVSMLIKFSAGIMFIPIIAAAFLYKKKRLLLYIPIVLAASVALLYVISQAAGDSSIFYQPFEMFLRYSKGAEATNPLLDLVFKVGTITWQLTPFLALLTCIAIFKGKGKDFWITLSWLAGGFALILFYSQDAQRYFMMLLPPLFVITAKYLDKFDFSNKTVYIIAALFAAFALVMDLNDLMGYYQPVYIAVFYVFAAATLLSRKHMKEALVGGFLALCIIFAFTGSGILQIGSGAVGELSKDMANIPYKEVSTSKDVSYYITPMSEPSYHCTALASLDKEFIKNSNISYIAFYSTVPRQADMEKALDYCLDARKVYSHGYWIGLTCEVDRSRL
jgi:4-amino-4-deoxy-L-arabinose transferase-like glycosyltransferase